MIDLSRYLLETLRKDEEFVLYRGQNRDDASRVLVLSPAGQSPALEILKRLEHEYSLKGELHPTWAARPLAIARHWDRTVLVLEDPGGVPLDQSFGPAGNASTLADAGGQPLERSHALAPRGDLALSLRLAISLSMAIGRLHQRGIIHKDIKPANVLANSAGQCWLTGFGIASRLPRERQAPEPPEFVAGTLAYMAPEQTGRMNRSIDSRSDLYAFGVTLYEILTGSLPFMAVDPMEWVHCHIARRPVPPRDRLATIPGPVSAIILKLLSKTAEERYQTAAGAESDLRRCLVEWETQRRIEEFSLGQHDTPDRLLIPEKLYGRAREVDTLLTAFNRVVKTGRPELVLVSGYSGIGKSSVVSELHKVLVPRRGLFASGKFDQYKPNIPYSTLAQAFQSLLRPLLGNTDAQLRQWRDVFLEALVPNAQLIVDLIPELKLITGEQPPVPELPPQDAQRRFQLVLQRFIGVFATAEHPLALFLDDLQWVDTATLDLLVDLLASDFADPEGAKPKEPKLRWASQPDVQYLLLIGAYRENEVDGAHPLIRKIEEIGAARAKVQQIILAPLTCEDFGQLIGDCFRCEQQRAAPLAQLVHEKTGGNPLFAIQFLSELSEEALLAFDHGRTEWTWDLGRIHAKGYTENVLDLMVGKLNRLAFETQKVLQEFACLGHIAEIGTLAIVHGASEEQVHADLWEAVRQELIVRLDDHYQFVHDRIQEAAYALIPEGDRTAAHLRIGRLLASTTAPDKMPKQVFEIVSQLNRGRALIDSPDERIRVAELNLKAANRAKASTAYVASLAYLVAGRTLLPENSWEPLYELTFALEVQRAECEFLTGDFAAAEERLSMLAGHAASLIDRAAVACLQTELYASVDQNERAVEAGLEYLRRVGVQWPVHPSDADVRQEYDQIWRQLGQRPIESLVYLPSMTDQSCQAILDVLTALEEPTYFTDQNLRCLVVARMVNFSLEHGNSDGSCVAYVQLGWFVGPRFGDYQAAFRFGQVGFELVEKHGLERFRARVSQCFGYFINPWSRHLRSSIEMLRGSFITAQEVGDLKYAVYACDRLVTVLLAAGESLLEVQRQAETTIEFARRAKFGYIVDIIVGQIRFIQTLRGLTPSFSSFNDADFDEERFERQMEANPHSVFATCWYWIRKLRARFYCGDYASALAAASRAESLLQPGVQHFEVAEYLVYGGLAHAAAFATASAEERIRHREILAACHEKIDLLAKNCPENFGSCAALISAEIARIEGREMDAERLFEEAIRSAQENGFAQNEALANELAARFYSVRGFEKFANLHLREARHCYLRWGAVGKVRQLEELYPQLREYEPVLGPRSMIGASVEQLDLTTVVKVSQTVSGEVVVEKLIDTLVRAAIEHAGAERGLLILRRGVEYRIEAEATTSADTIIVRLLKASVTDAAVPDSIVHYVARTQESVILDDAVSHNAFSADPYLRRHNARSILCLPLINQAKLIGVLYLENNLTPHVFTPTRIAVLKLLASQAAISLENTRLYRDLEEREAKIRRLVDANIIGIFMWNLNGGIIEANEALLQMVGYSREDLVSGCIRWTDLTPPEWRDRDKRAVADMKKTGRFQPFEKEYYRKDGSRVPVLLGGALLEKGGDEGVAFVLDLTEQKRAEEERQLAQDALHQAQVELARVSRMTTMEQLTASIAHEVNQPLAAVVASGNACLNWLSATPPNLSKARGAVERILRDGNRASDVLKRVRALLRRAPLIKSSLNVNDVVREVLALVDGELRKGGVEVSGDLDSDLPLVIADSVQLQQVILNLVMNAIESMKAITDRPRILRIRSGRHDLSGQSAVFVAVCDSGIGLSADAMTRVFEAFYTTKPEGMGMGLWICRSIIQAHGGQLTAQPNDDFGATFQFVLPASAEKSA